MTKPITGVALMTLYERGHFQLDDPVHRFIPEWRDLRVAERQADGTTRLVEPARPMSVRDALMHTTGLGWGIDGPLVIDRFLEAMATVRGGPTGTMQTMVDNLADKPLVFHPGTQWLYGLSTDVCGRLVEIMSGQRFDDYLRTEIFEPLQMSDTGFSVADDDLDRFAAVLWPRRDKKLKLIDDPSAAPTVISRRSCRAAAVWYRHDRRLPPLLPDAASTVASSTAHGCSAARRSS